MDQTQALNILLRGDNVYLTGSAGTGKTYLLNKFIEQLKKDDLSVAVTASTGIAATHLGGTTIHSWAGFGIKNSLTDDDFKKMFKKYPLRQRIREVDVLIIDEVSMLHAHQLDMVDEICRVMRKSDRPFGGIQVILCGDLFQLPPVRSDYEKPQFVVQSRVWPQLNISVCYLDGAYRQNDPAFLKLLNEIRQDAVSAHSKSLLAERLDAPLKRRIKPTKLYTHNVDVDRINTLELAKIDSPAKRFSMSDKGNEYLVSSLKRSCLAPEDLILKVGAFVMFVKNNFDKGYVNGTLGEVIGFHIDGHPIVETYDGKEIVVDEASWTVDDNGHVKAEIKQMPLRLAWAITIHKSQGMSLDAAEIDLSKSFAYGMGYVALSRVRSLNGIRLKGLNEMALKVDPYILRLDQRLRERSNPE